MNILLIQYRYYTLANSAGCSAYDGEFIALARSQSVPLITADKKYCHALEVRM